MARSSKYPTAYLGFVGNRSSLPISSGFGPRNGRPHQGIDIAVPSGTPLYAAYDGTVVRKYVQPYDGVNPSGGLVLALEHINFDGTKFYTVYMHLHSVLDGIRIGVTVHAGQQIGETGGLVSDAPNCGSSTGAHLHFETHINTLFSPRSNRVDPASGWLARHTLTTSHKRGSRLITEAKNIQWFSGDSIRTYSQAERGITVALIPVDETAIEPEVKKENKTFTDVSDRLAPGIWQITKLLADSSVEDKQVVDSSIAVQTGSLLNFFHKVCQEPFVEFMGDTYGSQYYFITRRPPTDREGVLRMMENTMTEISEEEVLSTQLDWNREGIYSWYQYLPQGDVIGVPELQYMIPAVLFPEYAQLWGSKPMVIRSNYYNLEQAGFFNSKDSKDLEENCNRVMRLMMTDFKYLVESNAYNPFVRRGTISIRGNRKIKRGTAVHLASTDEVFHVDAVSHSFNISNNNVSRSTVLTVSRGMFLKYINGVQEGGKNYSYFDIIDFGFDKIENVNQNNFKEMLSKWHVDWNVFGFFLQKQAAVSGQGDFGSGVLDYGIDVIE